jgi:hypothetical protein
MGYHPLRLQIPCNLDFPNVNLHLFQFLIKKRVPSRYLPETRYCIKKQSEAKLPSLFGGGFRTEDGRRCLLVVIGRNVCFYVFLRRIL